MKAAILQSNPTTGALKENARDLLGAVRRAGVLGADLCIAPELALCGYNAADLLLRPEFIKRCRETLNLMAQTLGQDPSLPALLLGAPVANPVPQGKPLQNCAVVLRDGKVTVVGRKVLLASHGARSDRRYFEPGVSCGVLYHRGWRLVVTIGEDVWNDRTFWQERRIHDFDPVAEFMGASGADGLINLTALPFAQGLPALHQRMLGWTATHYRVPVLAANMVGGNDGLVFYGASFAFNGEGTLAARAPAFYEDILMVDMAKNMSGVISSEPMGEEELWQAIVLGVRDFARKCEFTEIALGLSGGVDSALVAALAAEALGPEKVTGLLMPSPYSSQGSIADSLELAGALGIRTHTLPIAPVLESYERVFSAEFPQGLTGLAGENIQSRIRGALIMAHSNRFGALVLSTGNKSESAVGYCTLYGDTVGGLAPIADLYKHQVYALCRWYNRQRPGSIPEAILEKAPSAELRPGQKDSDSLPPYEVLDPLLFDVIENGLGEKELAENGYDPVLVERVLGLIRKAEFKRSQVAPVLQLTRRSFGAGWHMPIARGNF